MIIISLHSRHLHITLLTFIMTTTTNLLLSLHIPHLLPPQPFLLRLPTLCPTLPLAHLILLWLLTLLPQPLMVPPPPLLHHPKLISFCQREEGASPSTLRWRRISKFLHYLWTSEGKNICCVYSFFLISLWTDNFILTWQPFKRTLKWSFDYYFIKIDTFSPYF